MISYHLIAVNLSTFSFLVRYLLETFDTKVMNKIKDTKTKGTSWQITNLFIYFLYSDLLLFCMFEFLCRTYIYPSNAKNTMKCYNCLTLFPWYILFFYLVNPIPHPLFRANSVFPTFSLRWLEFPTSWLEVECSYH